MSNTDLTGFSEEIEKQVVALESGKILTWDVSMQEREAKNEKDFKAELLKRLKSGKGIAMESGGYGLEKLIQEILVIKGYAAKIQPKKGITGIADADIIATRETVLGLDEESLYIQVKHHRGETSQHGIKQIDAYDISGVSKKNLHKILITTGTVSGVVKEEADKLDIMIIEGEELVDLIYDNIEQLAVSTQRKLGVSIGPLFV